MAGQNGEQPDFYTLTVTVKMTGEQREEYGQEYGLSVRREHIAETTVADDVTGRIQADVTEALHSCYWLREFTSYSVSEPR